MTALKCNTAIEFFLCPVIFVGVPVRGHRLPTANDAFR